MREVAIWGAGGQAQVVADIIRTGTVCEPRWHGRAFPAGLFRSVCHIPGNLLNEGSFRIKMMFVKDKSRAVCALDDVLVFDVHEYERNSNWYGKLPGAVRPMLEWSTELVPNAVATPPSEVN